MDEAEKAAIAELLAMSREEVDLVQFEVVKWVCAGKRCNRYTKVRDYGVFAQYYWPRKGETWINITKSIYCCQKHHKLLGRLAKNYPMQDVHNKLFDYEKPHILPLK